MEELKQGNPPDKTRRILEAMLAIFADEATRILLSPSWRCSFRDVVFNVRRYKTVGHHNGVCRAGR
jgi:hypothetical protein